MLVSAFQEVHSVLVFSILLFCTWQRAKTSQTQPIEAHQPQNDKELTISQSAKHQETP
jgi:hypothetical protein